jgi:TRAM domain
MPVMDARFKMKSMGFQCPALFGRLSTQAPEIDGVVSLPETEAEPGEFVDVTGLSSFFS